MKVTINNPERVDYGKTYDYKYIIRYSNGLNILANMPDHIHNVSDWKNYYHGVIFHDINNKPYYVTAIFSATAQNYNLLNMNC